MREEWAKNTQSRIGVGPSRGSGAKPLRNREERMAGPRITKTNEAIPDYDESRARTEHLKAELLELERKQKEGVLIAAAEVEAKWVEIIVMARTKILGIPTKAKQRIPDLDVDAIGVLDDIVRETLEELANEGDE
jgi:phage terminase Nu1 subunit (DNA packaging protein)